MSCSIVPWIGLTVNVFALVAVLWFMRGRPW